MSDQQPAHELRWAKSLREVKQEASTTFAVWHGITFGCAFLILIVGVMR